MSSAETIGIMEGAYFVGRLELLAWLKDFFGFNYTKVEQCANGAAYCQIFDAIYPGKLALHRVKFNAKHEHEFIHNYKILQSAFESCNLKRSVPTELLIRAKYRDNLEFLQWFKRFFDLQYDVDSNYDGVTRRKRAIQRFNSSRHVQNLRPASTAPKVTISATPCAKKARTRIPRSSIARSDQVRKERPSASDLMKKENQRIKAELVRVKKTATELEKERDYYFNKLQQMDLLFHEESCENSEDFVQAIQAILYDSVPNSPCRDASEQPAAIACTSPLAPLPEKIKILSPSADDAKENQNGNVSCSPLF